MTEADLVLTLFYIHFWKEILNDWGTRRRNFWGLFSQCSSQKAFFLVFPLWPFFKYFYRCPCSQQQQQLPKRPWCPPPRPTDIWVCPHPPGTSLTSFWWCLWPMCLTIVYLFLRRAQETDWPSLISLLISTIKSITN